MKENEITCAVARDLMPLMIDNACSQDSKAAVEAHIAGCEACTQFFEEMKKEMPLRKTDDDTAAKGFQRSIRRQFRRFRKWQIASCVLAGILLLSCLFVMIHPQVFFGIETEVPVSWMKNPVLLRTEQNALLLRFTPAEQFRHFFYSGACSAKPNADNYEYKISFGYPWIAKLLNRDFTDSNFQAKYLDQNVIHLKNGDWAVPLPFAAGYSIWRYLEGKIISVDYGELTQEDIVSLLDKGIPVDGNTAVYKTEPLNNGNERLVLYLSGSDGETVIYQSGDEIPLCDQETQQTFDWMVENHHYLLPMPGDVIHHLQG